MKSYFERYSKVIGLFLLVSVMAVLFSTPSTIIAKGITTIGTELSHATGDETPVRTKLDFGNNEHLSAFPMRIGEWTGTDYNTTRVAESLGADVMLLRAYSHPELYQPMFFLIMQSRNRSSFHPPIVCYPALGYTIVEETKEEVTVHNASWAADPYPTYGLYGGLERDVTFNGSISVKKLIVVKKSEEGEGNKITKRKVVLYFYVKGSPFVSNNVTMVRVSALVPPEGSYDGTLKIAEEFMGDTIPCMFEIQKEEEPVLLTILISGSVAGKVVVVLLFLAPLILMFYPQLRKCSFLKIKPKSF